MTEEARPQPVDGGTAMPAGDGREPTRHLPGQPPREAPTAPVGPDGAPTAPVGPADEAKPTQPAPVSYTAPRPAVAPYPVSGASSAEPPASYGRPAAGPSGYGQPVAVGPSAYGRPAASPVAPPPREAWGRPKRVEPVPGTGFGVVHLEVRPMTSGLAVGALVAGIGSILVSLLVLCFGLVGAGDGWGGWVAGAFALLATLTGLAGAGLGLAGMRQIRRSGRPPAIRFTGRGLAVAGLSCGAAGLGITVLSLALTLVVQLG